MRQIILALTQQPAIDGGQHLATRMLDRPGFRRAVVIVEKGFNALFAGLCRQLTTTHTIGDSTADTLGIQAVVFRHQRGIKIFIFSLGTFIGILADGYG